MSDESVFPQLERWAPAFDFPGYEVSNLGAVRSWMIREGVQRRFPKYRVPTRGQRDGYLRVTLSKNSRSPDRRIETWLIHRLVMMSFCPHENAANLDVAHLDGDRENNRLSNLQWCTRKENEGHKIAHGTRAEAERNGQSKLSARDVVAIRELYKIDGVSQCTLAKRFRVKQGTISALLLEKTWRSVK